MDSGIAYDRVKTFLESHTNSSKDRNQLHTAEIKSDIDTLINKLQRLHSAFPELKSVDLSDHIYLLL